MSSSRPSSGLAWVVALVLLLQACAANQEPPEVFSASEWLVQLQSEHARADRALERGDRADALALLQAALERRAPSELAPDHLRALRQDLWFRIAYITLDRDPTQALLQAERGLALGRHDDLFTANLLVARGRSLQALGRDTEAASSYHEALALDERLLKAALRTGQAGGP